MHDELHEQLDRAASTDLTMPDFDAMARRGRRVQRRRRIVAAIGATGALVLVAGVALAIGSTPAPDVVIRPGPTATFSSSSPTSACDRWTETQQPLPPTDSDWLTNDLAQLQVGHVAATLEATPGLHQGFIDHEASAIVHLVDTTVLSLERARAIIDEAIRTGPSVDDLPTDRADAREPVPLSIELAPMCVPAQVLYDTRDEVEAFLIEEGVMADPGDLGPSIITAQLARGVVVVPSSIGEPLEEQLHERYGELVVIEPPMFVGEVVPGLPSN